MCARYHSRGEGAASNGRAAPVAVPHSANISDREKYHTHFSAATRLLDVIQQRVLETLGRLMLTGVATAQPTPSPVGTALAPGTFRLTVTDSALSLEANAASLVAICTAIGQNTGIEIVLHCGAGQTLTTDLAHVRA